MQRSIENTLFSLFSAVFESSVITTVIVSKFTNKGQDLVFVYDLLSLWIKKNQGAWSASYKYSHKCWLKRPLFHLFVFDFKDDINKTAIMSKVYMQVQNKSHHKKVKKIIFDTDNCYFFAVHPFLNF